MSPSDGAGGGERTVAVHVPAAVVRALWERTGRHRSLLPLLHASHERERDLASLPEAVRADARTAFYSTLARAAAIRETLEIVLDEAAAEGAPALPLKGSLLAFTVYPEPAARPMSDVDVAVPAPAIERVRRRLEARGWRWYGAGARRYDLQHHHHFALAHDRLPWIDLHARLAHELGVDGRLDPLLDHAQDLPLAPFGRFKARAVRAPSWEHHAFYVALHAATHVFAQSPTWIADLLHLAPHVSRPFEIGEIARAERAQSALHFALARACASAPSLAAVLSPPTPSPWQSALRAALLDAALGPAPAREGTLSLPRSLAARVALTDRPLDAARALGDKLALRLYERFVERRRPGS